MIKKKNPDVKEIYFKCSIKWSPFCQPKKKCTLWNPDLEIKWIKRDWEIYVDSVLIFCFKIFKIIMYYNDGLVSFKGSCVWGSNEIFVSNNLRHSLYFKIS